MTGLWSSVGGTGYKYIAQDTTPPLARNGSAACHLFGGSRSAISLNRATWVSLIERIPKAR